MIPKGMVLELALVRANLQSVGGAPLLVRPGGQTPPEYKNTGDLYMTVESPFIIGSSRNLSCSGTLADKREVIAGTTDYSTATASTDTNLKVATFYLMACDVTAERATTPQIQIKPIRARPTQGQGNFETEYGKNVRDYQHMHAQEPKATLAPRPDGLTFSTAGAWSVPLTLTTVSPLTSVDVWANPNDDGPLLEITKSANSYNFCSNGATKNDSLTSVLVNGGRMWVAMCGRGTATLELRDPFSGGQVVGTYVVGLDSVTTPSTKPSTPTSLSATGSNSRDASVSLTWVQAANATSYEVQQWSPEIIDWVILDSTVSISGTSATVTGLTNGQEYHFRVRGRNGSQVSKWTDAEEATPTVTVGNVSNLQGQGNSDGTITLTWTAGTSALDYVVIQWDSSAEVWQWFPFQGFTINVTGTGATVSGLSRGSCYYHSVIAKNGLVYSPQWSANSHTCVP